MGRIPCSRQVRLHRGPWTSQEDLLLTEYIHTHGEGRWRSLSKKAGLLRSGKSCRLRWMNYLRPDVKRGHILPEEEDLILRLHRLLGNRWSLIAGRLPGRTDNDVKNYWNCHLSKKLIRQGIDPRTHRPLSESEDIWWNPDQQSNIQEKIIRYTTSEDNANPETRGKDSDFLQENHNKDQICASMPAPEISSSQNGSTILQSATEDATYIEESESNSCENLNWITDGSTFTATPTEQAYGNTNSYSFVSFLESIINEELGVAEATAGFNSLSHHFLHHSTLESPDYELCSGLHFPTTQYSRSC